jgi:hypothetical protein
VIGLYTSYDLSHIPRNSEKIELLLLLVPWVNQFSEPKRLQSLRLLAPFFKQTPKYIGLESWYQMSLRITLLSLFHVYVLHLIQLWFHEYFGHVWLGGGILSQPASRFGISYPNDYYQIKRLDILRSIGGGLSWNTLVDYFYVNQFSSGPTGRADPLVDLNGVNITYTTVYTLWGPQQSNAWMSISGNVPIILISLLVILLIRPIFATVGRKVISNCSILVVMGYTWVVVYALGALGGGSDREILEGSHDFARWALFYSQEMDVSPLVVAVLTSMAVISVFTTACIYQSYDTQVQNWSPVSSHTILLNIISETSTQPRLEQYILNLIDRVVTIKDWRLAQQRLMSRSETQVNRVWYDMAPVIMALTDGINYRFNYNYFALRSLDDTLLLQLPKPIGYRGTVWCLATVWLLTPTIDLINYRNGWGLSWVATFKWLGVCWSGIIFVKTWSDLRKIRVCHTRLDRLELGSKAVAVVCSVLAGYHYDRQRLSNIWYGPWMGLALLANVVSVVCRHRRLKHGILSILNASPPLDSP